MGADTKIEWTESTWNPIRGCSRVSPGCEHCYAEGVAARFSGPGLAYEGLARRAKNGEPRWTGAVRMVPEHLADPLRWTKPRRVFVNSMSDLFHEKLTNEEIAAVFGVMAAAPDHTFQVLTKRAKRMREWFEWVDSPRGSAVERCATAALREINRGRLFLEAASNPAARRVARLGAFPPAWPLRNVWLGVSAENQATADERIPELLQVPAAVRWLSAEPLLGPLHLRYWLGPVVSLEGRVLEEADFAVQGLGWVVVGGESGPHARPFDVTWAREAIACCKAAGVPIFVKQLGARPFGPSRSSGEVVRWYTGDAKGGNPITWPEEFRVREFPGGTR